MDFQTLEISFRPEGNDVTSGRITHFAQFVEKRTAYAFPVEEDFLGIFINLGDNQRCIYGNKTHVFQNDYYSLMHLSRHSYTFVLERGYHSWLCMHYTVPYLQHLAEDVPMLDNFLTHLHDA